MRYLQSLKRFMVIGLRRMGFNVGWALAQQAFHVAAIVGPRPNLQMTQMAYPSIIEYLITPLRCP